MDIFEIPMMLQHMMWWPIFTIIKLYLLLHIIYILLKFMKGYAQSLGFLQPCSLPGINMQLIYPYLLFSYYKRSTPECPSMCALFELLIGFCRLYGKDGLFRGHLLFKPAVIFFKAEAVEAVLSSTELIGKSREYKLLQPWLGTGLVTSQGTEWRKHRKLLTPTFHFSILDECMPVFQEQANILISNIKLQIQESFVDIVPLLTSCSFDIICQTAMGVCMNNQKGGNCDYSNAILEIAETTVYRILRPWLYPEILFNLTAIGKKFNSNLHLVHGLSKKIMEQKIHMMTNGDYNSTIDNKSNEYSFEKKMRKPFLELLLEHHLKDPSSFTEEDVRKEVDTFMFAGHETTARAISWVLYCLGIYPEVQRQVHEELDAIFGNEMNENISREILAKMKYLECVIKETLRIYPVLPFISRENNQAFKALNYTVKKGSLCVILFWELHRDPAIFPDPEKFKPERFLPENCTGRHPYAFVPFSAGPRNCIGQKFAMMETKTVLACILRHFQVKSLDPRDKVLVYPNFTLQNAHPLRLNFEPR